MQSSIEQLKKLGRMPQETMNDDESIDKLIENYDNFLQQVKIPLSIEEAEVLVQLFPEHSFYDLQWDVLRLVESMIQTVDETTYIKLIQQCPSTEWKEVLSIRFNNYKERTNNE